MNGNTTIRLKIIQSKKSHLFLERKGLFNSYIYMLGYIYSNKKIYL